MGEGAEMGSRRSVTLGADVAIQAPRLAQSTIDRMTHSGCQRGFRCSPRRS